MSIGVLDSKSFIGRPATALPAPALVLSQSVIQQNINRLHQDVSDLGISFRPHVKTLKSLEVTRMMLQDGKHRSIVASTVAEIKGALPLVKEGLLDECLYGLPVYPGVLPQLAELRQHMKILLMIDHAQHIEVLEDFSRQAINTSEPWQVFIKVDVGSHRAGIQNHVPRLEQLVRLAQKSPAVSIHGFYCHAGHSYNCRTDEEAQKVLQSEIDGVLQAASLLSGDESIVVSVGATPTAHVIKHLKAALPSNVSIELHAGNFPVNDLQQVSTNLVDISQQAVRILSEVCSIYPERNEALVNAGIIAMSKETSAFPGFGIVVGQPQWVVVRLSQEHGIIGSNSLSQNIDRDFRVGQKVFLYCQHACITAAAFQVYYVVDEQDIVRDIWSPWKFW